MKPRLLDLFSGAGGAARGYQRAGFYVVGVDINPQPRYAGDEFHQADAMTYPLDGFDAIHASPPCQAYSITKHSHHNTYPDLVAPVRDRLEASGLPWVIENVVGAPLHDPLTICGTMFGLTTIDDDGKVLFLRRHRLFESDRLLFAPGPCRCVEFKSHGWYVGGVYGGGSVDRAHAQFVRRGGYTPGKAKRAALLGVDWMTQNEMSQSIPPDYTQHIGVQLMRAISVAA